jgi:GTP-binding protein HflX
MRVTGEVLAEIGAVAVPRTLVLNKADRLDTADRDALAREFPDALLVSARQTEGVERVREAVVAFFAQTMREAELFVPWEKSALTAEVRQMNVLEEVHTDDGTRYRVRAEERAILQLRALLE